VDDEEGESGVRCVAVAILDSAGKPVAAVSVSGPAFRITRSMLTVFVKRFVKCTQGICKEMGYIPQGVRSLAR
jgi:IclR family acetate operon transcriptional repressor